MSTISRTWREIEIGYCYVTVEGNLEQGSKFQILFILFKGTQNIIKRSNEINHCLTFL